MSTETTAEIILCPAGNKLNPDIPIDLGYWAQQETRIAEIATCTPGKAPELLASFNRAALELDRLSNLLELEHQTALREAEKVRAEVLLDRVPRILASKGLTTPKNPMGSEDLRNAVLAQDPDLDQALERAAQLKAMSRLIRGKYDAFERAFRSVRTLVGEQNFNYSNRSLSGDTGTGGVGTVLANGFGKPRL
jgi:hypothetical protein